MILQFAWRYFKGRKSTKAIQIIAWVSVFAMAIGTASLIIVLSVFNGFESFIKDLYSGFYPPIRITALHGKHFQSDSEFIHQLNQIKGIRCISKTLEEKVLLSYGDNQVIATLKGVDSNYEHVSHLKQHIRYGQFNVNAPTNIPSMILGIGVSNRLGATEETHLPITVYSFNGQLNNVMDMAGSYSTSLFDVTGIYVLQEEIDNQYVFASLDAVEELLRTSGTLSSLEILPNPDAPIDQIIRDIKNLNQATQYKIDDRYQQNKTLYFILKSERWAVYAILTLMLFIASFNIVGSMSMLVLDKEKDIAILKAMGMLPSKIKKIFVATGILLSLIGVGLGCLIALLVCVLQQHYGFVKLGGGDSFLLDAYPVKLLGTDFVLVLATVIIIAFFASLFPAMKASRKPIELRVK